MSELVNYKYEQPIGFAFTNNRKDSEALLTLNSINLTINIFFDGTGNNKHNTEKGMKGEGIKGNMSHGNYYSNIALLEMAFDETAEPYNRKIYIQGAGTFKDEKDSTIAGLAMGKGDSGIKARVAEAFDKMKKVIDDLDIKPDTVTLHVFGFSRGSAYARHFCHLLARKKNEASCTATEKLNSTYLCENIIIDFVGILDTVSSLDSNHYNDVEEYGLDINERYEGVKKLIHFTAKNEYRKHFPLTRIKAAVREGTGFECEFPGAHSDIGGGYTEEHEEKNYRLGAYSIDEMDNDWIHWTWFRDQGYYRGDDPKNALDKVSGELNYNKKRFYYSMNPYNSGLVTGNRIVLHYYQFIPLEIMAEIMRRELKTPFQEKTDMEKGIAKMKKDPTLAKFAQQAFDYVMESYPKRGGSYVIPELSQPEMKYIYNKYIHNSLSSEWHLREMSPANTGHADNKHEPFVEISKNTQSSYPAAIVKKHYDYLNPKRIEVMKGFRK